MNNFIKNKKYPIVAAAIFYALSLLVCVAMFLPRNVGGVLKENGSANSALKSTDVENTVNCSLDSDGTYTILSDDPQMIFSLNGQPTECIKLNISSPCESDVYFELYTAVSKHQFSVDNGYRGLIFKGQTSAVVDVPQGEYYSLRIDINTAGVRFESVELYEEQPNLVPFVPEYSFWDYICVIFIPIVTAALIWFIECKTNFCQKAFDCIKKNKLKILKFIVFSIVAMLLATLIETIIGLISDYGSFNVYRWVFFAGVVELIVVFVLGYKNLKREPEKVFLPVVIILGLVMLFGSPVKHICWDLDSHYKWAIGNSYSGTSYFTLADTNIIYVGQKSVYPSDFCLENYKDDLESLEQSDEILAEQRNEPFILAHLPEGIFISVARLLNASFAVKYNIGRLSNLLIYAIVCYFAIRKIKSGKMILSVICLFPTSIFLATNYAYDWCVTSFSILGTSYFVSELQQPDKKITVTETLIMCLSFTIAAWTKLVYIILIGMTLFMCKNWKTAKDRKKYYLILSAILVVVFAWFLINSFIEISGTGDVRGGNVDPSEQLRLILSNPWAYAKVLIKFLVPYLSISGTQQYISNFAYLGLGNAWIICLTLLGVTVLTDADNKIKFKIPVFIKCCSVVLFVCMAAVIATTLYLAFTPVGQNEILGCQPRYIIPLIAPLLLLVSGQRINIIKNKSVYNGVVLVGSSIAVMIDTYTQIITKMI